MSDPILVGIDGSPGSQDALRWALVEAARTGAEVTAAIIWQQPGFYPMGPFGGPVPAVEGIDAGAAETLAKVVADVDPPDGVRVQQVTLQGPPAFSLLDLSESASLVVVGSRGRGGFARLVLGSVSQQCAMHATVPTVVVPPGGSAPPVQQAVVVGVDGSENSSHALDWALDRGRDRGDQVIAVMAYTPQGADRLTADGYSEDALTDLVEGTAAEGRLVGGDPRRVLVDQADGADLVVVGARGHEGLAGAILGSVTTYVLHNPPCPVVVVPRDES